MEKNVGSLDRTVRIGLGALLVIVGIAGYAGFVVLAWIGIGQALASVIVFAIGAILLVTGLASTCLIYSVLGVDTRGAKEKEPEATAEKPA